MEKHTPTPWKYERPSRIMLDAGIQRYAIYRGTEVKPEWIGEIHFAKHDVINDGLDENKANAELIVKAVNNHDKLVEALKRLLFTAPWNDSDEFSEAKSKARELLKHLESNPLKN